MEYVVVFFTLTDRASTIRINPRAVFYDQPLLSTSAVYKQFFCFVCPSLIGLNVLFVDRGCSRYGVRRFDEPF